MPGGNTLWMPIRIPVESGTVRLQCGPLVLWMRRWQDEFHCAVQRQSPDGTEPVVPQGDKPVDLEWTRWVCGRASEMLCQLKPLLPPRPVVVRPQMPLQVLPHQTVNLFVSIPVWVRVCLRAEPSAPFLDLLEEPSEVLSNSWFGQPTEGEFCYSLKTRARRVLADLRSDAHLAVCPLTIRNESAKSLAFDRLCLRVPMVGVFEGDTHLWTHPGTLVYRGGDTLDEVTFDEIAPSMDGESRRLADPRDNTRRSGMRRAIDRLITGGFGD